MTLATHHLEFTATALSPIALGDQAGASIRGAIVGGLWERFCANKAAPTCADCPLIAVCPVAELVAPMRADGEGGGEQRPRPYVVRPPAAPAREYPAGTALPFGLALIGPAARLFPYLFMAAREIEQTGLGRRLPGNAGLRACFRSRRLRRSIRSPAQGRHYILIVILKYKHRAYRSSQLMWRPTRQSYRPTGWCSIFAPRCA